MEELRHGRDITSSQDTSVNYIAFKFFSKSSKELEKNELEI